MFMYTHVSHTYEIATKTTNRSTQFSNYFLKLLENNYMCTLTTQNTNQLYSVLLK